MTIKNYIEMFEALNDKIDNLNTGVHIDSFNEFYNFLFKCFQNALKLKWEK